MKLTKTVVRILAVFMLAAMAFSLVGCVNSYANNPLVAKVGSVKLYLNDYLTNYNNSTYSQYLSYGLMDREQYANYILDALVLQGVQLDQLKVQNITLTAEEEADVLKKVDEEIADYVKTNYLSKVDSSITDDNAKYEAAFELFKKELKENGSSYDEYLKSIQESYRNSARIDKLRELTVKDVTVTLDEVKTYIKDSTKTSTTASDFYTAWSNFVSLSSSTAPLFMPHPERAVEDDPETTDKDESQEANPYGEFFSVMHLLCKFSKDAGEDVTDLAAYASEDVTFMEKATVIEEELPSLTLEDFLNKCADKDVSEDPGMLKPSYQYFGYIMQESLLSKYYDGFGYAAMKLKFGEDWKSDKEKEDPTSQTVEGPGPEYDVTYFELADGVRVAKVYTNSGAHYIVINENDIFSMYNEEGYLDLPVYDNGQAVTDAEGVVTVQGGHMTLEKVEAVNEALSHLKSDSSDKSPEDAEPVTLKSMFEYYYNSKLDSAKNSFYSTKVTEWKENTRIVLKKNVLKAFYKA